MGHIIHRARRMDDVEGVSHAGEMCHKNPCFQGFLCLCAARQRRAIMIIHLTSNAIEHEGWSTMMIASTRHQMMQCT